MLDHIHPGAGPGQQLAARGAEQEQRQPHAQGEGIEGRTAEPEIATLGHVDEGPGERRRGAGGADQSRDHAHDGDAGHGSALLAVGEAREAGLQAARQLQGVEPEHGEGEQHEHHREADEHIGVLKGRLELQARRGDDEPEQGIGDRHPLHIDEGEQEGATGGEAMPGPGDDPGQDGIHGEDAGGEGEAETQGEEGGDADPEPMAAEGGRQPVLLAARPVGALKAGRRFRLGGGGEGLDGDPLVGRWVAESLGAALVTQSEAGRVPDPGQRHGDLHLLVIDPALAEEVILVLGAGGQDGLVEGEVLSLHTDAVAIEVVAVGDAYPEQQPITLLFALEGEGLIHLEESGLGLDAEAAEQILAAGPGGGRRQDAEQAQQHQQEGEGARGGHEVSCVNQSR